MGDIVKLLVALKRVRRRHEEERAAKARSAHGIAKADRTLAKTERSRSRCEFEGHRIETGESDEIAGR